jgi:hypothetical protein
LNPDIPAVAQLTTFPFMSVKVMMVLLNVARTWASPVGIFFFSFRFVVRRFALAIDLFPQVISRLVSETDSLLLFTDERSTGPFTGPGIGSRLLATNREVPLVTFSPVTADFHQAFDIGIHLPAKITFDLIGLFDFLSDFSDLISCEVISLFGPIHPC